MANALDGIEQGLVPLGGKIRPWSAIIQYPGLKKVMFGTVPMPFDARHDEIMNALVKKALEHIPAGFEVRELLPGAIFFSDWSERE